MQMNGAEIIIKLLERQGIETIAGIPGGANLPLYDALSTSRIRHVLTRHEQGAGFIAQGMARSTGKTAVCLATSGPGATNLVTAVADAYADSVPVLFITGQVPETLLGTDAFQEVDIAAVCASVTKRTYRPAAASDLHWMVVEALRTASDGRSGPVLLDIPKNIQLQDGGDPQLDPSASVTTVRQPVDYAALRAAAALVNRAERPVFYAGGGLVDAEAHRILRVMAHKAGIPVVTTLMGLGTLPYDDPLFLGMVGMHGTGRANRAVADADLIIAAGARFNDRSTGPAASFCPSARVIHIDIDPDEPGKLRDADCALVGDAAEILRELNRRTRRRGRSAWMRRTAGRDDGASAHNTAQRCINAVGNAVPGDTIITTDVGQHQMWTAQAYPFRRPRTLLTSGGLGTMGFGLPAAIGAALANPDRRVVCFSGDGSIMMNIQELATLAEHGLDVAVVLFDNNCLGMVRQQQELFYGNRTTGSLFAHMPNFTALASAFGIRTAGIRPDGPLQPQIAEALGTAGPVFIHVPIPEGDNVYPMVRPGSANTDMITAPEKRTATENAAYGSRAR